MTDRPHYESPAQDSARWEGFAFRPDDIIVTTAPKCGTTWMQRIVSLLVFQDTALERPLTEISPWLELTIRRREDVVALLDAQRHRRFIKSHTPLNGLPSAAGLTYVCVGRDPRDVALSWDDHMANSDVEALLSARENAVGNHDLAALIARGLPRPQGDLEQRFWHWMDDPTIPLHAASSLRATLNHFEQALAAADRPDVVVLHFADLQADLEGVMRGLAVRLGISVPEARWPGLVAAASFAQMRERADLMAPDAAAGIWKRNRDFFRAGGRRDWHEFFDAAAEQRYAARLAALTSPAVADWAHRGAAARRTPDAD